MSSGRLYSVSWPIRVMHPEYGILRGKSKRISRNFCLAHVPMGLPEKAVVMMQFVRVQGPQVVKLYAKARVKYTSVLNNDQGFAVGLELVTVPDNTRLHIDQALGELQQVG